MERYPREARAPDFFFLFSSFSRSYPHRIHEPLGGFTEPRVPGHQTLVIPVHPGLRDFQDFFLHENVL